MGPGDAALVTLEQSRQLIAQAVAVEGGVRLVDASGFGHGVGEQVGEGGNGVRWSASGDSLRVG